MVRRLALAVGMTIALFAARAGAVQELGLNVHQSTGVGLDVARDAKMKWVRIDLNWLDAQPTSGAPSFALFDTQVDNARARGLSVLAVLAYTPAWASTGDGKGDGPNNDVPVAGAYAAFVTAVVSHFAGRIDHYELWNEPNLAQFWEGTPQQYIDLVLKPGADAVHAGCPACRVVGPGLATVGGQYATWMEAVLSAAADKLDIVSGHDYAAFPTPGGGAGVTSDSFFNKLDAHRVVTVGGATVYEGPLSFREELLKHNVQKPFWLTETGLEAPLGDAAKEDAQALYYRHVLEAMLTRPWWSATIFYEGFDEPGSGYTWGVAVDDAAAMGGYDPKPVLALLQQAAGAQPAFGGTGSDCDDGLDNDGDGLVDFPADPGCAAATSPSEGAVMGGADAGLDGGTEADGAIPADDGFLAPADAATTTGTAPAGGGCALAGEAAADAWALLLLGAALAVAGARATRRRGAGRACSRR